VHERKELDRARTRFLEMMAHEMRTPLTPLRLYVHALGRAASGQRPIPQEVVDRVIAQIDRLAVLVQELGDSAQLDAGRPLRLHSERVELGSIVRRALEEHRASLALRTTPDRGHTISFTAPEPCFVCGDRLRLEEVVTHLLDNALKFSPHGGSIEIDLSTDGRQHRLTVTDHGIGVPTEELAELTHKYFRATNALEENYPGMGLGLSLCREIVERHGGTLSFESTVKEGTRAIVTLPAEEAA
jgi:signal transduction histidine kinase